MDLAYDSSFPLRDLASCLDAGSQSGPGVSTGDEPAGTAQGENSPSSSWATLCTGEELELGVGVGVMGAVVAWGPCSVDLVVFSVSCGPSTSPGDGALAWISRLCWRRAQDRRCPSESHVPAPGGTAGWQSCCASK